MTVFDAESSLYVPSADPGRAQRIKVLDDLGLGAPDPEFDAFAAELAQEAGLPYGMVNLFKDRQLFAGLYCSPEGDFPEVDRSMPLDHGYCPATIEREAPLVLPDVLDSPGSPAIPWSTRSESAPTPGPSSSTSPPAPCWGPCASWAPSNSPAHPASRCSRSSRPAGTHSWNSSTSAPHVPQ